MDNNSVNGKFTEDQLETAIIELFQAQEYPHVLGDSIHRRLEDILLTDDLRNFLSNRYNDLTTTETEKIISACRTSLLRLCIMETVNHFCL